MTLSKAIEVASDYQAWRRGEGLYEETDEGHEPMRHTPTEYGVALDVVILAAKSHHASSLEARSRS